MICSSTYLGLLWPCASPGSASWVASARANWEVVLFKNVNMQKTEHKYKSVLQSYDVGFWCAINWPAQGDSHTFLHLVRCWPAPACEINGQEWGAYGRAKGLWGLHTQSRDLTAVLRRYRDITSSSRVTTLVPTSLSSSSPCCSWWYLRCNFHFLSNCHLLQGDCHELQHK